MSFDRHLILQEFLIQPSDEWTPCGQRWIIIGVAEGAGYWLKKGRAGELNVGDGLVLGFEDKTKLRASVLCPMKLQFFTVQPQYLSGLLTVTEWHQIKAGSGNARSRFLLFRASEPMGEEFARLTGQSHESGLSARCALLQFWANAVAGLLTHSSAAGYKLRERFRLLFGQMPEMELATCSLQELAQHLHCSKRHLCRLFREYFGVPLRRHQAELRLVRARQFLAESNANIKKVASQCGYRNLSFFIKRFRKRFGITPGEWRRQARKNLPEASPPTV